MKPTLLFTRNSKNVKRHMHLKNGVFNLCSKKIKVSPMQFERNDSEVSRLLYLNNSKDTLLQSLN